MASSAPSRIPVNGLMATHVTHVPYRGGGPAANDLIGGQIDYICLNMGSAAPLIMGKQVKAIATLSRSRSPLMPDLNGLRRRDLERLFSSERCAQRDCQEAQRRNEPGYGHAGN